MCIAAEISENSGCVSHCLLQYPGQRDGGHHQKDSKARHGAEGAVLNGRDDLDQAHKDAGDKAGNQKWRAEPEHHQHAIAHQLDSEFRRHGARPFISDPITRSQPSTSTNSRILKGADNITRGAIASCPWRP